MLVFRKISFQIFNLFPDFYTSIQVAHNKFIKSRTEYTVFKSLSKMSQEQAAAVVIIALTSESREKRQKIKVGMKLCLKRRKNFGFYETLLAKLRLEDEYSHKNFLRMTPEKFSL